MTSTTIAAQTTPQSAAQAPATQGKPAAGSGPLMSAEVAAQVKQALAPAAAGAQHISAALDQGKATLSGLGQLKSALAAFQGVADGLTAEQPAGAAAPEPGARLQSFVDAYNTLNGKLQELQKSGLKGDPGLAQVRTQLANMVSGASAAFAKAGVTIDGASGAMKLDKTRLASALAADPASVTGLFAADGRGIVDQLADRMGGYTAAGGVVARESASTSKQVDALAAKQATLTKALTAQANALAAFYTQQANMGNGPRSLFDMLA